MSLAAAVGGGRNGGAGTRAWGTRLTLSDEKRLSQRELCALIAGCLAPSGIWREERQGPGFFGRIRHSPRPFSPVGTVLSGMRSETHIIGKGGIGVRKAGAD